MSPQISRPKKRILLADDEPRILAEYAQILSGNEAKDSQRIALAELARELFGGDGYDPENETYDLCLCRQSDQAVAAVQQSLDDGKPFAVAFLDFRMPPGPDGVVTAELIRKLDANINIVFVTAYSDVGLSEIAARVPPPDKILYCHKPLHASELRQFAHALSAKWSTEGHLQAMQARLGQIINSSPVIVYCREPGPRHRATFVSSNIRQFDYDEQSFLGDIDSWLARVHPEDLPRLVSEIEKLSALGDISTEYRFRLNDGSFRWVSDRVKLRRDGNGQPKELVGCLLDISELRLADERIRYLAYFDGLTGLPNRVFMRDLLDQALASAERYRRRLAILFLDLDQFKRINDTLGHAVGDHLLREVSARLLACLRRSDAIIQEPEADKAVYLHGRESVSRLGGDEFVVILSEIDSPQDAATVARRIELALAAPVNLNNDEVSISASIGISVYPDDATDVDSLLKHADAAMYHAKEEGRNCYQFFSKTINDKATRRFAIETSLRKALDRGELSLSYQPRIDIQTYSVVGMEALLRWQMPDGTWVTPSEFVPIAEETGLIVPIGEWVFYQACRQAVEWARAGLDGLTMSINLSAVQFKRKRLVDFICTVLDGTGLDPQQLELELTESLLIDDTETSRSILGELKQYGLKISLDDFGTGYSSLSYLKNFPFNALKLDQSLIQDVACNANDAAIVRATIALAHSLGLRIVAEGVEQQAQLDFLVTNGCDEAQGHLFTPALDVRAFERWMRNWPFRSRPLIEGRGGSATTIEAA